MNSSDRATADAIIASGANIVTANNLPAPVVGWVEIPPLGAPLDTCPTSMCMAVESDAVKAFNACNAGDMQFGRDGTIEFDLSDWIVYSDEGPDPETGEVSQFTRVVLIAPDGETFRTTSPVVLDALDRLIRFRRQKHFDPPVPVLLRERKSPRTGRTYHELRLRMSTGGAAS